jgi:hypothetical protein
MGVAGMSGGFFLPQGIPGPNRISFCRSIVNARASDCEPLNARLTGRSTNRLTSGHRRAHLGVPACDIVQYVNSALGQSAESLQQSPLAAELRTTARQDLGTSTMR